MKKVIFIVALLLLVLGALYFIPISKRVVEVQGCSTYYTKRYSWIKGESAEYESYNPEPINGPRLCLGEPIDPDLPGLPTKIGIRLYVL